MIVGITGDSWIYLIQINACPPFARSSRPVLERRTNVPADSLMVTIAVLVVFAFFMVVLGYASFDESRRQPRKPRLAPVKADAQGRFRQNSVKSKA
jgi:hypothetical protein